MTISVPRPINILLVEDSPSDQELTREAFVAAQIVNDLAIVETGNAALDYIYQRGDYTDVVLPDLVLLDLNLPGLDGREVLAIVKADDNLKHIPVIVLTTSDDEHDVLRSYGLHANCYLTKPVNFTKFTEVMRLLGEFWLVIVKLPHRPA